LLTIRSQLIKEPIADTFILSVAQQAPELMLTLCERDKTGDIVAILIAG
jgi:hypothetical protein